MTGDRMGMAENQRTGGPRTGNTGGRETRAAAGETGTGEQASVARVDVGALVFCLCAGGGRAAFGKAMFSHEWDIYRLHDNFNPFPF